MTRFDALVADKLLVAVFSKSYCPYCRASKSLLSELGAKFYVIELDQVGMTSPSSALLSCSPPLLPSRSRAIALPPLLRLRNLLHVPSSYHFYPPSQQHLLHKCLPHCAPNTDDGADLQDALQEINGQRSVPNIYIAQKHIGGNSDLQAKKAELPDLLKDAGAI